MARGDTVTVFGHKIPVRVISGFETRAFRMI